LQRETDTRVRVEVQHSSLLFSGNDVGLRHTCPWSRCTHEEPPTARNRLLTLSSIYVVIINGVFNHSTLGVCSSFLYHGASLSWLCCCSCTMGGSTHMRTQRPASHGKKVILQCATSNRQMSSISGPATTRRGSYSVCVFLGAVGRVGSCHGSACTPTRRCFP